MKLSKISEEEKVKEKSEKENIILCCFFLIVLRPWEGPDPQVVTRWFKILPERGSTKWQDMNYWLNYSKPFQSLLTRDFKGYVKENNV